MTDNCEIFPVFTPERFSALEQILRDLLWEAATCADELTFEGYGKLPVKEVARKLEAATNTAAHALVALQRAQRIIPK